MMGYIVWHIFGLCCLYVLVIDHMLKDWKGHKLACRRLENPEDESIMDRDFVGTFRSLSALSNRIDSRLSLSLHLDTVRELNEKVKKNKMIDIIILIPALLILLALLGWSHVVASWENNTVIETVEHKVFWYDSNASIHYAGQLSTKRNVSSNAVYIVERHNLHNIYGTWLDDKYTVTRTE